MTTIVLLQKELAEHLKTYKLLIVMGVLLAFGLATPLLLVYMPQILSMSGENVPIELPQFTTTDAVKSYLDSMGQIGLLAIILISMGAIAQEREHGTAALVLSKPVGIASFVLAKLLGLAAVMAAGLAASALGFYAYTTVLLGSPDPAIFAGAMLLVGVYLLFVISVTLLFSALLRNQVLVAVTALATVIGVGFLGTLSVLEPYLPGSLMHWAYALVAGQDQTRWPALAVSLVLVVACVLGAWRGLRHQEL